MQISFAPIPIQVFSIDHRPKRYRKLSNDNIIRARFSIGARAVVIERMPLDSGSMNVFELVRH